MFSLQKLLENLRAGPCIDAVREYLTAVHIHLATNILRLPLEIREMIPEHMWTEKNYIHGHVYAEIQHRMEAKRGVQTGLVPLFVMPTFVGTENAREIMKACYRHTSGRVNAFDIVKLDELDQFVLVGSFGLGYNLASVHLRTLTLKVLIDCILADDKLIYWNDGHLGTDADLETLNQALEPLTNITKKKGSQLRIQLQPDRVRLNVLPTFFDALRPYLLSLQAEGADVRIYSQNGEYARDHLGSLNDVVERG